MVHDVRLLLFTVLLSIYNKESPVYFSQAIESIWNSQTLKPEQIVLVKDGPLTPSLEREIDKWSHDLGGILTIVSLTENVGLAAALNHGLQYCKHDLVARMDTDDISTPERFKLQVDFMLQNPEVAVSSGYIEEWDANFLSKLSCRTLPLTHDDIVRFAKVRSPISHPACIFRKSVILKVGGYERVYPEDHLLWTRVLQGGHKMANLPSKLLLMRTGDDFITRRGYIFLKGELASYKLMYNSNFLTLSEFLKVSILRSAVRLSPKFIKLWLYKKTR
ncbi:glycosyltransferase [Aeromonas veronii]|uniref:glycosyltransferase n=1 Tax=Aeromonas veronii TaxID=654 RepID=UPI003B9F8EA7